MIVKAIRVSGNQAVSTEEISELFRAQLGKSMDLDALSQSIDKVEQIYHDRGFVLARVADVNDDDKGVIQILIHEGLISEIDIQGVTVMDLETLQQNIGIRCGDTYNEKKLVSNIRLLYSTGCFEDIKRALTPEGDGNYVLTLGFDQKDQVPRGLIDTWKGVRGYQSYDSLVSEKEQPGYRLRFKMPRPILKLPSFHSDWLPDNKSEPVSDIPLKPVPIS